MNTSIVIDSYEVCNVFKSKMFSELLEKLCVQIAKLMNQNLDVEDEAEKNIIEVIQNVNEMVGNCSSKIEQTLNDLKTSKYQSAEDQKKIKLLKDSKEHLLSLIVYVKDNAETKSLYPNSSTWYEAIRAQIREVISQYSETLQYWEKCKVVILKSVIKECLHHLQMLECLEDAASAISAYKIIGDAIRKVVRILQFKGTDITEIDSQIKFESSATLLLSYTLTLGKILKIFIPYLDHSYAKIRTRYGVQVLRQQLNKVLSYFVNSPEVEEDERIDEEPGHFVTKIDMALDVLSLDQRYMLRDKLNVVADVTVEFCLSVARVSSDEDRDTLVKTCREVMKQKSNVMELYNRNEQLQKAFNTKICIEFDIACETLSEEFEKLEKLVSHLVLKAVMLNFLNRNSSINELLKTAANLRTEKQVDRSSLEPMIESFTDNFDKLHQTALFTVACSTDFKKCGIIGTALNILESIDPEIIPGLICYVQNNETSNEDAAEYLRLLHHQWKHWIDQLFNAVISITDPSAMMKTTCVIMHENYSKLKDYLLSRCFNDAENAVNVMIGCALQVSNIMANLTCTFLNGKLTDLQKALNSMQKVSLHFLSNCGDTENQKRLLKYASILNSVLNDLEYAFSINKQNEPFLSIDTKLESTTEIIKTHEPNDHLEKNNLKITDKVDEVGSIVNEYSLADMMEEIASISNLTPQINKSSFVNIDSETSLEASELTIHSKRGQSYRDSLSSNIKEEYQSLLTSYSNSILQKTGTADIPWSSQNNGMVATALEMCKLLNNLSDLKENITEENVGTICNKLLSECKGLSIFVDSLTENTTNETDLKELQHQNQQVTSSCTQLSMIMSITNFNSDGINFDNGVLNILPKFSANVKRDLYCLLSNAEQICLQLNSDKSQKPIVIQWKVKDNVSLASNSSIFKRKGSMQKCLSLRRLVIDPVKDLP